MEKTTSIIGENDHYDVFISHKHYDYVYLDIIIDFLEKNGLRCCYSEKYLDETGECNYRDSLNIALINSDSLIVFLSNPNDFCNWVKYEFDYFVKYKISNDYDNYNVIPILKDIDEKSLPFDLKGNLHCLSYGCNNFLDKLVVRLANKTKKQHSIKGFDIFLFSSKNENNLIDIPLNYLSYCGLSRFSMTGIFFSYILDIQRFEEFEKKIHYCLPGIFKKRTWFKLDFEVLENINIDDFRLQHIELLGIIIEVKITIVNRSSKEITEIIVSLIENIMKYYKENNPAIIINLFGNNRIEIANGLKNQRRIKPVIQGISPSDYESYFESPVGRWACVVALREYFKGTMNAIVEIMENKYLYDGSSLHNIIELAEDWDKDDINYENDFLENIDEIKLLTALQCGYKFKMPFRELINYLGEKGISHEMIGLVTLCCETKYLDFNVITTWNKNQRKFLGLFSQDELNQPNNQKKQIDDLIPNYAHKITYHQK